MPPAKETVTFNPKMLAVMVGLIITLFGAGFSIYSFGSSYHEKFATSTTVDAQVSDLNKEIITLAIQSKEDDLSLIEFKQATGQATDLDTANKANIERRLEGLRTKLDKLEE